MRHLCLLTTEEKARVRNDYQTRCEDPVEKELTVFPLWDEVYVYAKALWNHGPIELSIENWKNGPVV